MKNLNLKNKKFFEQDNNFQLSDKIKTGVVVAALVLGIPAMMFTSKNRKNSIDPDDISLANFQNFEEPVLEDEIKVSLDEINRLNIIINDSNCGDALMEHVTEKLEKDGITFSTTSNNKDINLDNSVVITLDQTMENYPGICVIAPYNNNKVGNSDALALALDTAFYEKGFFTSGIQCGVYDMSNAGETVEPSLVPSMTEESIADHKNISSAIIAFGNSEVNGDLVTSAIENALARYTSYINRSNVGEDLIKLDSNNNVYKNPIIENIREFNKIVPINVENVEKTVWSK